MSTPRDPNAGPWRAYLNLRTQLGLAVLACGLAFIVIAVTVLGLGAAGASRTTSAPLTLTQLMQAVKDRTLTTATLDERAHVLVVTRKAGDRNAQRVVQLPDAFLHDTVATLLADDVPLTVVNPINSDGQRVAGLPAGGNGAPAIGPVKGGGSHGKPLFIVGILLGAGGLLMIGAGLIRARRLLNPEPVTPHGEPALAPRFPLGGLHRAFSRRSNSAHVTAEAERPDTRFSDVAGCEEAVFDLTEIVLFLKDPDNFCRLGAEQPKGGLLVGPPGTGKTLLARAVAGEAEVPFFPVSGSDFVEKYVGVGPQRVRAMFQAARKHEKAIIFIDEIDAIGVRRSGDNRDPETEKTLLALLHEMDGFAKGTSVVVLAATNRPDILDPALVRPGRLDRRVEVPNPDRRGREKVLAVHTADKPVAGDVDLTELALRTPGFSGAQLAAVVNEACTDAVRRNLDVIPHEVFSEAVATIAMGRPRTSALVTEHDAKVTAWHEAGHTLAAFLQRHADDPVQVSIVPRGAAGGVTWMSGNDDIFLTRLQAHAKLVTAMAGRVGEELGMHGEFTQGACHDFETSTDLATRMATQYGMTDLGFQFHAQADAKTSGAVVERLLHEAYETAHRLLSGHRALLEALVASLLVRKDLALADIETLAETMGAQRYADLPVPSLPGARATGVSLAKEPALAAVHIARADTLGRPAS